MNKRDSMKWPLLALLLAGGMAVAEEWHPSGFQPAPVFEDEGLPGRRVLPRNPPAAVATPAPVATPKAHPPAPPRPAAETPPPAKSVSLPEETIKSSSGGNHPARPEPPPVFEDEGLPGRRSLPKHPPAVTPVTVAPAPTAPVPSPAQPVAATPAPAPSAQVEPAPPTSGEASGILSGNYPIGLILLSLAGFVFWNSRRPTTTQPSVTPRPDSSGKTGVQRYLEQSESSGKTGVARYLSRLDNASRAGR